MMHNLTAMNALASNQLNVKDIVICPTMYEIGTLKIKYTTVKNFKISNQLISKLTSHY